MNAHLARRYDGPVPPLASSASDADEPLSVQWANRRRYAWMEVRDIGRQLVHHSRMFRETHSLSHHNEWKRLRKSLSRALTVWSAYRG